MNKVSKGRWTYSFNEGKKAEQKFVDLMSSRGNIVVKSSRSEDIHKHIDYYVNDIPIDVKGNRHLETIWLEITNVRGKKGWLQGESKYIVFDIVELKSFCFFKRIDLLQYVLQFKEKTTDKKHYNRLYTRDGRDDVIVKVKYKDISHLETQSIKYE